MLVRDNTPVYSPLGRWAGRRMSMGDLDIGSLISGIGSAVKDTAAGIGSIAVAAKPTQPAVGTSTPYVTSGGIYNPPQQAKLPAKAWYQDPLLLGAVGLGIVGVGVLALGRGRRGAMAGFSLAGFSYGPRRKRRHSRRRHSRR